MTDIETMPRNKLTPLSWTAIVIAVIGAINWGLVGLFEFDLVGAIFGELSPVSRIIYVLVALSGLYLLFHAPKLRDTPRARGRPVSAT